MSPRKPYQIPLAFRSHAGWDFTHFYAGKNQGIVEALIRMAQGEGESFLFLAGGSGLGKTHLLCATSALAHEKGKRVAFLPLRRRADFTPDILQGIETCDLVCLDDCDAIAGHAEWEEALLHAFNRLQQRGCRLLVSSRFLPAALPLERLDLQSRMSWGLTLQLQPLDDAEMLAALTLRARRAGMELPEAVGRYLMTHFPRDPASLWALLDRLEQSSLAAQRTLSIPFVKTVLEEEKKT